MRELLFLLFVDYHFSIWSWQVMRHIKCFLKNLKIFLLLLNHSWKKVLKLAINVHSIQVSFPTEVKAKKSCLMRMDTSVNDPDNCSKNVWDKVMPDISMHGLLPTLWRVGRMWIAVAPLVISLRSIYHHWNHSIPTLLECVNCGAAYTDDDIHQVFVIFYREKIEKIK